ncbi:MAG TPA: 6-carboxytetrahydropterin synthase [Roseiarcus sp.]|jgi:6-pyruvoyl-tetrahydropterin synthase|nr:6-carboxytetrahydropterin synthase [Roseiarcus sp.]
MFAVEVRDSIMVAHSLRGDVFGPAQALHGATFVVDVAFFAETLSPDGVVVDIGRAAELVKEALAPLNYRNLDEVQELHGVNSTTEALARHIHEKVAAMARVRSPGREVRELSAMRVSLSESHVARAWYEAPLS